MEIRHSKLTVLLIRLCGFEIRPFVFFPMSVEPQRCPAVANLATDALREGLVSQVAVVQRRLIGRLRRDFNAMASEAAAIFGGFDMQQSLHLQCTRIAQRFEGDAVSVVLVPNCKFAQ